MPKMGSRQAVPNVRQRVAPAARVGHVRARPGCALAAVQVRGARRVPRPGVRVPDGARLCAGCARRAGRAARAGAAARPRPGPAPPRPAARAQSLRWGSCACSGEAMHSNNRVLFVAWFPLHTPLHTQQERVDDVFHAWISRSPAWCGNGALPQCGSASRAVALRRAGSRAPPPQPPYPPAGDALEAAAARVLSGAERRVPLRLPGAPGTAPPADGNGTPG